MVAIGLWSPLVWLPVIYDIRYTDMTFLGGTGAACVIVAMMAVAALFRSSPSQPLRNLAWLCVGGALALATGTLWDICRWAADKVLDLGGEALIAQMQYRKGTPLIGIGMILWLIAMMIPTRRKAN